MNKGTAKVVIMDIQECDTINSSLAMLKLLTLSTDQVRKGQVVPAERTIAELRTEIAEKRGKMPCTQAS
jgi:hypothetical protein